MQAKFIEGSVLKHICVMTLSATAGILLMFLVDVLDLFWLSLLGEVEITAALGFSGAILFFTLSVGIGLSIGCSAVVSQAIGAGAKDTKVLVGSVLAITFLMTIPVLLLVLPAVTPILEWMGASEKTTSFARSYMYIVLPTMPLMTLSMACTGVMRAFGHAKKAMYISLIGASFNGVFDPIFIFGFGWGIEGAAAATSLSRFAMITYALWQVIKVHQYFEMPSLSQIKSNLGTFFEVALPALLTNMATPISFGYVTAVMAGFGDAAVSGNTVITKIQPVAFAGIFALSGAIGPIVGQNFGANRLDRVMEVLQKSAYFILVYCLVACGILFLLKDLFIDVFRAEGDAADIIGYFCLGLSTIFVFNGLTFSTTAMFNNLKLAHWATYLNFVRATIFTMPFAYLGAKYGGPVGIWVGMYLGSVVVALFGVILVYTKINSLRRNAEVNVAAS